MINIVANFTFFSKRALKKTRKKAVTYTVTIISEKKIT